MLAAARPLLPESVSDAAAAYAEWARERFGARLRFVRLFGSWARGEA
jgi:predicted nucleotidyltransferase